jgi:predicted GTPase
MISRPSYQNVEPQFKYVQTLNVLIMGRTGAGKTTFINSFFNLANNRNFQDDRLFPIPAKFKGPNRFTHVCECNMEEFRNRNHQIEAQAGGSDTKVVSFYNIKIDNVPLLLIDTPGFGDCRGPQQDEINANMIVEELKKRAQIHAIIWVCKSDENRATIELKYCIEKFKSMLTDDYQKNIFFCFSYVTNPYMISAMAILRDQKMPLDLSFNFDNGCLIPFYLAKQFFKHYDEEDFNEIIDNYLKAWNSNQQNFKKLVSVLLKIQPCSSMPILLLHHKKRLIEMIILSYRKIDNQTKKAKDLIEEKNKIIRMNSQAIRENQNYEIIKNKQEIIQVKKRLFWLIPYIENVRVDVKVRETNREMKLAYEKHLERDTELNKELEQLLIAHESCSSDLNFIRDPIFYLEDMIKRKAMSKYYRNIHAQQMIKDLIQRLKSTDQGDPTENKKEIKRLTETLEHIQVMEKIFEQRNDKLPMNPNVLQRIIHYCKLVSQWDVTLKDPVRINALKVLNSMQIKFNPKTSKELLDMQEPFELALDQFINTVFIGDVPLY